MLLVNGFHMLQAGLQYGQFQNVGCVIIERQILQMLRMNETFALLYIHLQGEFDVFFLDI